MRESSFLPSASPRHGRDFLEDWQVGDAVALSGKLSFLNTPEFRGCGTAPNSSQLKKAKDEKQHGR